MNRDDKQLRGTDLSTVESQRNDLAVEEFPEGAEGNALKSESLGKSTPWRPEQRSTGRFDYENHELHKGLQREYPGEDVFDERIPDTVEKPRHP